MIWLLKPDQPRPTEFAPAMDESTGILPGLPAVAGKPVQVAFDGGRLTSDAGILLLAAIEQRLGIAERLADASRTRARPSGQRGHLSGVADFKPEWPRSSRNRWPTSPGTSRPGDLTSVSNRLYRKPRPPLYSSTGKARGEATKMVNRCRRSGSARAI